MRLCLFAVLCLVACGRDPMSPAVAQEGPCTLEHAMEGPDGIVIHIKAKMRVCPSQARIDSLGMVRVK